MKERRDKHQKAFEDGFLQALKKKKGFYIIDLAKALGSNINGIVTLRTISLNFMSYGLKKINQQK
jgi:hypothetical protein